MNDLKKLGKTTNMCFVAGTQVLVQGDDGEQATKPIEKIEPGDMVWSRSDLTGEQGFKPVLQTFVTRPVELVHLTYRRATGRAHGSAFRGAKAENSGDGDADPDSTLVGTPNHPFWSVTRQAWVEMGRLQPGERLLLSDGREAVVETLERECAPAVFENWTPGQTATGTLGTPADPNTGTFTTYNFEVADWHTYFVSDAGAAVWVHNQGALCPEIIEAAKRKPELVNKMNLDPQVRRELQDLGLLPSNRAIVPYDPEFATKQILGDHLPLGHMTPGGRQIMPHAAERMMQDGKGRIPMSKAEVDRVLNSGDKIKKVTPHPQGDTVTIQNTGMPGKPQVVVDAATGKRIVTVVNPRR